MYIVQWFLKYFILRVPLMRKTTNNSSKVFTYFENFIACIKNYNILKSYKSP